MLTEQVNMQIEEVNNLIKIIHGRVPNKNI